MTSILSMMLAIVACGPKEQEVETSWDQPADHTLLMYIVGDNNLSQLLEGNVKDAQRAVRDSILAGAINLVVMKDNKKDRDSRPILYWVHRNAKAGLDTVVIRSWDKDVNIASPTFMADVVRTTFTRFDTRFKGMSLGSHGSGWAPLGNNNNYSAAPPRRAFGQDDTYDADEQVNQFGSIELWDLSKALAEGPKLDYILMDCCHMGTAEVAYELRQQTHYMLACPNEEEGDGLPYISLLTALSRCHSDNDLRQSLSYGIELYQKMNKYYGAISALYDLTKMDELAAAYKELLTASAANLQQLANMEGKEALKAVENLQYYGRNRDKLHNRYYYFDIDHIITSVATSPSIALRAQRAVEEVVIDKKFSNDYRGIPIFHCSGMAVSIPEVLHAANYSGCSIEFHPFTYQKLATAYHLTAWGAYMGY